MGKRGRKSVVASAIDPLLLEGGKTVSEVADLVLETLKGVTNKDGEAYKKSAIVNNVRQRMIQLQKQGYTLAKDAGKRLTFGKDTDVRVASVGETMVRKSDKEITR